MFNPNNKLPKGVMHLAKFTTGYRWKTMNVPFHMDSNHEIFIYFEI